MNADERGSDHTRDPIDYRSPTTVDVRARPDRVLIIAGIVAAIVIATNIWMFTVCSSRDWDGFFMAAWGIPIVDGIFLATGLACTPLVVRAARGASVLPYLLASVAVPAIATLLDILGPH